MRASWESTLYENKGLPTLNNVNLYLKIFFLSCVRSVIGAVNWYIVISDELVEYFRSDEGLTLESSTTSLSLLLIIFPSESCF